MTLIEFVSDCVVSILYGQFMKREECTFLCGFDLQVLSNMIDLVLHVWPLQVGI